jgi:aryl-alcohol dehydrogenase-like predicted oxidoreductase
MILLQFPARFHVAFILISAQVLSSIATILARATARNKIGHGDVFPDIRRYTKKVLTTAWFSVSLIGLSRKHIFAAAEQSLKRLGVDYIDLYQIPRFDYNTPIVLRKRSFYGPTKSWRRRE